MFSFIDRELLGTRGSWNNQSQLLVPEKTNYPRSVILIHGFIGSPFDMKPLGRYLVEKGVRVVIPAIPGQTFKTPLRERESYSKSFYIAWLKTVVQKETSYTGMRPDLVGFSMGGTLSAIIAKDDLIKKLVLIAPFFKLPNIGDTAWSISRKLAPILPYLPKLSKGRINLKKGYQSYVPGSCFVSLKAFNHLGDLAMEARRSISNIRADTRAYISKKDQVADSKIILDLFENHPNASIIINDRANHILLYDHGADRLIRNIGSFLLDSEKDNY